MEDAGKVKDRVGWRIAAIRKKAGLTQAEVADRVETTTANYQRIEYGGQNLTLDTMVKIANALRVPIADLFEPAASKLRRAGRPAKRPPPKKPR